MARLGELGPGGLPPPPAGGPGAQAPEYLHPGHRHGSGETLSDLYAFRSPLYQRYAGLTVDVGELTLEETVAAVLQGLDRWGEAPADPSINP